MPDQGAPRGEDHRAERRLPVPSPVWHRDLADDAVRHRVEQVVLAAHVGVERHRLDPELLAEPAHADRLDPVAIGKVDGSRDDPFAGERCATLQTG